MSRWHLTFIALVISHSGFSNAVYADPDLSIVRATVDSDMCHITAAGRTRVDLVIAVTRGLKECSISAEDITIGPWLRLPKQRKKKDNQPVITVCVGGEIEGGNKTAYIGITPKTPLRIVYAVAEHLRQCGLTDVRLLSEETIVSMILPMASPSHEKSDTPSQKRNQEDRTTK